MQLRLPLEVLWSGQMETSDLTGGMDLREWMTRLWVRYQGSLLEFANFHLRDRDRAEDVVQDTWVDFQKSLPRFEGRCSPQTWLLQILRRRINKELRRMILRRAREAILEIAKGTRHNEVDAGLPPLKNQVEDPEKSLLRRECLEYILRVSRSLPQRQTEVWILRDLYGWTSEDVSTALNITAENERVLLHRARLRLKKELELYLGKSAGARAHGADSHDLQRT